MRPLLAIAALAVASAAPAATVRLVPLRAGVPESQALAVVRATEAALRETSTLVLQPAMPVSLASKRCGAEDPGCWSGLAARAGTDYGLVVVADAMGGLTVDLVLVDLKARRVAQRRFTAPGVDGAVQPIRASVEALVPPFLRRGFGGFLVELPKGARLKVDGRVVLAEPSRAPVPVPNGRHEVDLLLPDGSAVLTRADVAEGQTEALRFDPSPPAGGRRSNDALLATSAALWTAGTISVVTSLALASLVNVRTSTNLAPCAGGSFSCVTLEQARAEQRSLSQVVAAANILLVGGGVLAVGGAGVFTFDLVQGGSR